MNKTRGIWRGKRIDNKKWVEGHYFYQQKGILEGDVHYIVTYRGWGFSWLRVDPSTLGECTGLRDKNGKLIFEGDIVEYKNVNYEIKYIEGFAAFSLRSVDNMNYAPCITTNTVPHMSVIGNVHDNPKLLKGAEDETMDKTRN